MPPYYKEIHFSVHCTLKYIIIQYIRTMLLRDKRHKGGGDKKNRVKGAKIKSFQFQKNAKGSLIKKKFNGRFFTSPAPS